MLGHTVSVPEILWNFYRSKDSKHITLQQNPHFYLNLPTSVDSFGAEFRASPAEYFHIGPGTTIYILVDRPRRVFLETQRETRIFSNVFKPKDVMILKGALVVTPTVILLLTLSQMIVGNSRENQLLQSAFEACRTCGIARRILCPVTEATELITVAGQL